MPSLIGNPKRMAILAGVIVGTMILEKLLTRAYWKFWYIATEKNEEDSILHSAIGHRHANSATRTHSVS